MDHLTLVGQGINLTDSMNTDSIPQFLKVDVIHHNLKNCHRLALQFRIRKGDKADLPALIGFYHSVREATADIDGHVRASIYEFINTNEFTAEQMQIALRGDGLAKELTRLGFLESRDPNSRFKNVGKQFSPIAIFFGRDRMVIPERQSAGRFFFTSPPSPYYVRRQ